MTLTEVMSDLEAMGNPSTKKTLGRHGAREPFFGVRVGDMKKIVKKVKKDHELSLQLYNTHNYDAMYLAGLIADEDKINRDDLQNWVENAYCYAISEYTVAWIAAESRHGWELAMKWIQSPEELIAACGWSTLSSIVAIAPNEELDLSSLNNLLDEIARDIHKSKNRERYTMNQFLISVGAYIPDLHEKALEIAQKVGKVTVNMGDTACKVPDAKSYIDKMLGRGPVKKKKQARC